MDNIESTEENIATNKDITDLDRQKVILSWLNEISWQGINNFHHM